jgi:D-3-phosphoglycerate dehydrogenase
MSQVLITDHVFPTIESQRRVLESAGFKLDEIKPNCQTEDDVIQKCGTADVLLVQWAPITRRVLRALRNVKCVVRYGIGVDNIDLVAAKDLGVTVANVPDYCVEEVSDHALTMICSLCKRIPQDHYQIEHGGWGIGPFRPIPAFRDLTIGLVGFGAIARRVAEKAGPFGFHVIASDPFAPDQPFYDRGVERVNQETLLRSADVISLHCPLLPETTHLINQETIAMMRQGVILVNTARGLLVNERDLSTALSEGKIAGAGLDVFEVEPLPTDSSLRGFGNVLLTSHAAAVSERAIQMLEVKAASAARDFLILGGLTNALVAGPNSQARDKSDYV